jgi:hypothetical protein
MKLLTTFGIVLVWSTLCSAQKPEFACTIATLNLGSGSPAAIEKEHVNEIAHFDINETMEEEPILKYFRVPKTRWFAGNNPLNATDPTGMEKVQLGRILMRRSTSGGKHSTKKRKPSGKILLSPRRNRTKREQNSKPRSDARSRKRRE